VPFSSTDLTPSGREYHRRFFRRYSWGPVRSCRVAFLRHRSRHVVAALLLGVALACASAHRPCRRAAAPAAAVSPPNPWTLVWPIEFSDTAGASIDTTSGATIRATAAQAFAGGQKRAEYTVGAREHLPDRQRRAGDRPLAPRPCRQLAVLLRTVSLYLREDYDARQTLGVPGRVEARIKLAAGQGLWPALLDARHNRDGGWPTCGELDNIMENKASQPTCRARPCMVPATPGNTPFAHQTATPRRFPPVRGRMGCAVDPLLTWIAGCITVCRVPPSRLTAMWSSTDVLHHSESGGGRKFDGIAVGHRFSPPPCCRLRARVSTDDADERSRPQRPIVHIEHAQPRDVRRQASREVREVPLFPRRPRTSASATRRGNTIYSTFFGLRLVLGPDLSCVPRMWAPALNRIPQAPASNA